MCGNVRNTYIPFVVRAHAALEVDLLLPMLVGVVGIFSQSFQSERRADFEVKNLAGIQGDEVALEAVDDDWQNVAHNHEWSRKLHGQHDTASIRR
jgi:hypothetical protein